MSTAERTDPDLWEKVKSEITRGEKGGNKGEWSARKAQMAVQEYKKRGGGYRGKKPEDNHLQQWTDEDWGTKSGEKSKESGERYLPKAARKALSDEEYRRTTAKKRADTRKGKQFSGQPDDIAGKTAPYRRDGAAPAGKPRNGGAQTAAGKQAKPGTATGEPTKKDLVAAAKALGIGGASSKSKADLTTAIRQAVRGEAGERMTKADLQSLARTFHADVRASMTKAQLQKAIASGD